MELQLEKSFDNYVMSAHETAQAFLSDGNAAVRGFRLFHDHFRQTLWGDGAVLSPTSGVLIMNAYLLFLSGAHTALQGHAAAVFPLLRTALENACYAFLIAKDSKLESVWFNRHQDEASKRASRAAFAPAVRNTAEAINVLQPQSGNIILECYESAIDFGGHPNPRGVVEHLRFTGTDQRGWIAISLTALHGPNDFGTQRALIACLEFASTLALIIARTRPKLTRDLCDALIALNAAKEEAICEFGLAVTTPP